MRLKHHILDEAISTSKWNELKEVLDKDCIPYINHLKGCKSLLRRGHRSTIPFFKNMVQRQDRRPLLIPNSLHELMDNWTNSKWGFKARSTATFTTNREHNARSYGTPYIMFPIGKFDYAWSSDVHDLYYAYDTWEMHLSDAGIDDKYNNKYDIYEEVFADSVIPELEKYKTFSLGFFLKTEGNKQGYAEAIIHCKSYYLINPEWLETLISWYGDRHWRSK